MSFLQGLFGSGAKKGNTVANNLSLQTSVYGNVIPIVYGTTRVAPNLIWYSDFTATPVSQGKGGKGSVIGGGGKSGGGTYQYSVAVAMALCEGAINGILNVYVDKSVVTLADIGMSLFDGAYPQEPWSFLLGQQTPVVEVDTIPSSSPYTVTVSQGSSFYADAGQVYINENVAFSSVAANPAQNQYSLTLQSGSLLYTFNVLNAGANVTITVEDAIFGTTSSYFEIIPSMSPYQVLVTDANALDGITDKGVISTGQPLVNVSGSPSSGQYSYAPGGVYTFNAAQEGQPVSISYYTYAGTAALGYNGIAYVANASYQLGESASLPNHNFEVQGVFSNSVAQEIVGEQDTIPSQPYTNNEGFALSAGQIQVEFFNYFIADNGVTDIDGNPFTAVAANPGNYQYAVSSGVYWFSTINYGIEVNINYQATVGYDADPSLVINDLLTNEHYGAAFPSSNVGNLSVYQAYCIANGLLISPCYNQQQQSYQILQDIATATNSAFVWSEGLLNLIPYGDQAITANGYTYTPDTTPVYTFNDNYLMKNTNGSNASASAVMNDDPVLLTRKRPADQINSIKIECLDRNNNYNTAIIEAKDQALIENFGLRQSASNNSHLFCNLAAGKQSAMLQLQRQAIRNIYSIQLDQRFIFLDCMDIIAINDPELGLVNQLVRILEITENDDRTLSISAEEYLYGTGSAATYNFQTGNGYAPNYNISPGNVNIPVIFEPTDALAGELAIWIAVSGQNTSLWGGCDVYLSTDGETYANVGRIKGAARQGLLSAPLSSVSSAVTGQTIDQTNTLSVTLAESNTQLISGSQTDATNLNTLCYVDGEYIAYQTATLTANDTYNLTYLVRGAYDSTISSHLSGAQFARLDSAIFEYPYAAPLIGATVLIKFCSFNVWGGGYQDISGIEPYTYIVQGTAYTSPLPNITGFATAYVAGLTQLIWDAVDDFRAVDYEVRQGTTWSNGNVLYRTPLLGGSISGDGTYWVAAHFTVPNGGEDIYSENPVDLTITGSQLTQNVIASYDQAALSWPGTFNDTAVTSLGLQLAPAGNVLALTDYLNTPNILFFGTYVTSGTYTIPSSQIVNVGRVTPCQVIINLGAEVGYPTNAVNILGVADYLNAQNILGIDLGNNTSATAQIQLSQDGVTWGAWQTWIPGSYSAKAFNAQVLLASDDPTVLAVLTDFVFIVDVPTLTQSGNNIAIPSSGSSIVYPYAFNAGVGSSNVPNLQVTILNASSGETANITSNTLSSFNIQLLNSASSAVAGNINFVSQGY
jgi:Putative phage tail protein